MTQIRVHNGGGDALVYTSRGHLIGPHRTLNADPSDRVTGRLLDCGRLIHAGDPNSGDQDSEDQQISGLDYTAQSTTHITQAEQSDDADVEEVLEEPAGNATTEAWADYAVSQGYDREDVAGMGRTEIQELLETTPADGDQSADEAVTTPGGAESESEEEK